MSMPSNAELATLMSDVINAEYRKMNQSFTQAQQDAAAAVKDAILGSLTASARDFWSVALGDEDFTKAAHWEQVVDWLHERRDES